MLRSEISQIEFDSLVTKIFLPEIAIGKIFNCPWFTYKFFGSLRLIWSFFGIFDIQINLPFCFSQIKPPEVSPCFEHVAPALAWLADADGKEARNKAVTAMITEKEIF